MSAAPQAGPHTRPPDPTPAADTVHVVQINRKSRLSAPTLAPADVQALETAFRAARWWRDRWTQPAFRAAAAAVQRGSALGGLVFLGHGLSFTAPPPFDEFFEPIHLTGLTNDPQLRTLTGNAPTRDERTGRIGRAILVAVVLLVVIGLGWSWVRTGSTRVILIGLALIGATAASVGGIVALTRLGRRWYLVPGGVALVGRRRRGPGLVLEEAAARRGQSEGGAASARQAEPDSPAGTASRAGPASQSRPTSQARPASPSPVASQSRPRVELYTPQTAFATLRHVHTGKTVVLVLSLCPLDGARIRTQSVSDRQALAFLAAWQSRAGTPTVTQLAELS